MSGEEPREAVFHITHWKADVVRSIRGQRRPPEERGLGETDANHLIYMRWRDHSPQEVLTWHRQVHDEVLVEVPPREHERAAALTAEVMAGAAELRVPLAVNLSFGATWADAKG